MINNPGGQLRAEDGKTIAFIAPAASNNGLHRAAGRHLQFRFSANQCRRRCRSTAMANCISRPRPVPTAAAPQAGFNNSGNVNFSGGDSLVFGTAQMNAGSHLIASGGAVVTFFDVFRHSGAEVKASAGSALVFFGEVRGAGYFTGSGTVYMEGGYSPGASPAGVTIAPQIVFAESNILTMEIGGLTAGTSTTNSPSPTPPRRRSRGAARSPWTLINGYTPAAVDVFDIFDFDAARDTGTFTPINLPSLPGGLTWDTRESLHRRHHHAWSRPA